MLDSSWEVIWYECRKYFWFVEQYLLLLYETTLHFSTSNLIWIQFLCMYSCDCKFMSCACAFWWRFFVMLSCNNIFATFNLAFIQSLKVVKLLQIIRKTRTFWSMIIVITQFPMSCDAFLLIVASSQVKPNQNQFPIRKFELCQHDLLHFCTSLKVEFGGASQGAQKLVFDFTLWTQTFT